MSVVLNEPAIDRFFEDPTGPVAQEVERYAQRVVELADLEIQNYFASAISLTVSQDVDYAMDGPEATIGIRPSGRKSQLLAAKQRDGTINWLLRSFRTVFPFG